MRTKGLTTAGIWVVGLIVIDRLINSLRYTEFVANPNYFFDMETMTATGGSPGNYVTMLASGEWQLAVFLLIAFVVLGLMISTGAMWAGSTNAITSSAASETDAASQVKAKRRDPEREARLKRLLDTMDEDELEALEAGEMTRLEEPVSVESLMRRRSS